MLKRVFRPAVPRPPAGAKGRPAPQAEATPVRNQQGVVVLQENSGGGTQEGRRSLPAQPVCVNPSPAWRRCRHSTGGSNGSPCMLKRSQPRQAPRGSANQGEENGAGRRWRCCPVGRKMKVGNFSVARCSEFEAPPLVCGVTGSEVVVQRCGGRRMWYAKRAEAGSCGRSPLMLGRQCRMPSNGSGVTAEGSVRNNHTTRW